MKFSKKFLWYTLGVASAISMSVYAAKKISSGEILLGTGVPGVHKIESNQGTVNDPFIQYNNATSTWQFTNDGSIVNEFSLGGTSGGGGGQNFFTDNPDAEAGTSNWTNIGGGTFTTFSVTPINGNNSFRWDASASGDILRTDQVAIPEKFKGQACQVDFTYTGGTDDLVKPQVVDSLNVKLASATYSNLVDQTDFLKTQVGIVKRSIFFTCPLTGTIAFEFNQTAAGNPAIMDFDDIFIGDIFPLKQVKGGLDSGVVIYTCDFDGAGNTITNTGGLCTPWVSSLSVVGTGNYDINVNAGIFKDAPTCTCTTRSDKACAIDHGNNTSILVRQVLISNVNGGGQSGNQTFVVTCMGRR